MFANMETSWEKALKYIQEMSIEVVDNKAAIKNRIGGLNGSLNNLYFLVVQAWKVHVMYGWKFGGGFPMAWGCSIWECNIE